MSDQIVNVNSAEIWSRWTPPPTTTAETAVDGNSGRLSRRGDRRAHLPEERLADLLGSSDDDVVVRIYGENAEVLDAKADEVQALITDVDGVAGANVERALEEPTV